MSRKGSAGTTTRYIVGEAKSGGVLVNIYEVRPTKVNPGDRVGYHYHAVSQEWFSRVEDGISVAEIAFRAALNSGFHEVIAGTSAGR
jgi:hypothetical protein